MPNPLEPDKKNIHVDRALQMEQDAGRLNKQDWELVEPGRRNHPLSPSPERYQMDLDELADDHCPHCFGKGIIRIGTPRAGAPVYPVPCSCAEAGYQEYMKERILVTCRYCGQTGWCPHRPKTLSQLFAEAIRDNIETRMAMGERPAHNLDKFRRRDEPARTEPQSNRPNQPGAGPSLGGQQAPGGRPEGRQGPLPGLQPGSGSG